MQEVILVNEQDIPQGTAEKMEAHLKGWLHRAYSILIFASPERQQILLQRRAMDKYHSRGLWTNACCSHQQPDGSAGVENELSERLDYEMGVRLPEEAFRLCFKFIYRTELESGLIEHELDYVYEACYSGAAAPNSAEVSDWKWMDVPALKADMAQHPEEYTFWFHRIMERL